MSKSQSPPPLIQTESLGITTLEEIMREYMLSEGSLFTLTELNDIEIDRFSRAFQLAEWLDSKILKEYLIKKLLLRISRKRRGRDEIQNMLQQSSITKRMFRMSEPRDEKERIPL